MEYKFNRLIPDNLLVSGKIIKADIENKDNGIEEALQSVRIRKGSEIKKLLWAV